MAKLQKQKAWERGKETYYKWVVVIPEEVVEKAGMNEGDSLFAESTGKDRIILKGRAATEFIGNNKQTRIKLNKEIYDSLGKKIEKKLTKEEKKMRDALIKLFDRTSKTGQ